ncbi:MAG: hypothetical protein ACRDN6_09430 [Gaiellaceae bacterium]
MRRLGLPHLGLLVLLVVVGLAIAVAWGLKALTVYAFFAVLAAILAYATVIGGKWLEDSSRGRFRDRDRDARR